jgi:mannosyltransferase OCH1-like enzyme
MIPKIIHRVTPLSQTDLMVDCWKSIVNNTFGWKHVTHYDNEKLPITGKFLSLCSHGAFRADLIRLESLYIHGGIYLDSDIKLLRPIDSLLGNDFFVVKEEEGIVANSVIGSHKKNPILLDAINLSIDILIKNGLNKNRNNTVYDTGIAFGPYVITEMCKKYKNINVLQTKTFFPYSYKQKELDVIDYSTDNEIFGVHKWAGSWLDT